MAGQATPGAGRRPNEDTGSNANRRPRKTNMVAAVYAHYAGLSAVQALFYGIAPAVMAIITIAAYKLVRLTDGRDWRAWAISAP